LSKILGANAKPAIIPVKKQPKICSKSEYFCASFLLRSLNAVNRNFFLQTRCLVKKAAELLTFEAASYLK
jgi:hypothetical protein